MKLTEDQFEGKRYITIEEYFGKRAKTHESELTAEYVLNARVLTHRVNKLLMELKWAKAIEVRSGWRPESVNVKVANAAKKSGHIDGRAVDLADVDGSLGKKILDNVELLRKHNLWLENVRYTDGWVHLDIKRRHEYERGTERLRPRVFNP